MEEEKKYLSDLSLSGLVKLIDGDKEKGKESKENSKGLADHFQELKNANEKVSLVVPTVSFETMQTQLQRGRDRY